MIQAYEIDENGYIRDIHVINAEKETNHIKVQPPNGLYRAKWTGTEWVEDMTQQEIDELETDKTNNLPTTEEQLADLQDLIIEISNKLF